MVIDINVEAPLFLHVLVFGPVVDGSEDRQVRIGIWGFDIEPVVFANKELVHQLQLLVMVAHSFRSSASTKGSPFGA